MKKHFLPALLLLFAVIGAAAQGDDKALIARYANDTTHFTSFPEVALLSKLSITKKYSKLEIDTWSERSEPHQIVYGNYYRYPKPKQKTPDSVVIAGIDPMKSFAACWCPSIDVWYIAGQRWDGQIAAIGDKDGLKTFLGKIGNQYDAYLWLFVSGNVEHQSIPITTLKYFNYKKVKDGFLISYYTDIGNKPSGTTGLVTYLIGKEFKLIQVNTRNIRYPKPGDIIYKI